MRGIDGSPVANTLHLFGGIVHAEWPYQTSLWHSLVWFSGSVDVPKGSREESIGPRYFLQN